MKTFELLQSPKIGASDPPYAASQCIARLALRGAVDKQGKPVYDHVDRVLQRALAHMNGENVKQAAVKVSSSLIGLDGKPLGTQIRSAAEHQFMPESYDEHLVVHGAILHDVVEDSDVTIEELARCGYSSAVLYVVDLLTCEAEVPYVDYIDELCRTTHQDGRPFTSADALEVTARRAALLVKAVDHKDNTSPERLEGLNPAFRSYLDARYEGVWEKITTAFKKLEGPNVLGGALDSEPAAAA